MKGRIIWMIIVSDCSIIIKDSIFLSKYLLIDRNSSHAINFLF